MTAPAGVLPVDPIGCNVIFPATIYRASSNAWLLDNFSTTTLRQVLEHRTYARQQRRLEKAKAPEASAGAPDAAFDKAQAPRRPDADFDEADVDSEEDEVAGAQGRKPRLRWRRQASASCCMMTCCSPRSYFSVFYRELLLAVMWSVFAAISIWLIVMGSRPQFERWAWIGMLLLGYAGLSALYHSLRVKPAARLSFISSAAIRRHVRLTVYK